MIGDREIKCCIDCGRRIDCEPDKMCDFFPHEACKKDGCQADKCKDYKSCPKMAEIVLGCRP